MNIIGKRVMDKYHWLSILRGSPWLIFALVMVLIVGYLSPSQVGVLAWSLSKVSLGAYLGYWMDRSLFPRGRPHEQPNETLRQWAWLRRAIVIAAAVLGMGLGI